MLKLFHSRSFYIILAFGAILLILFMAFGFGGQNEEPLVTTTVEIGSVRELVSVSGIAEADQTAELAFPVSGIVESVSVKIGDVVESGDLLISLNTRALQADRQDALALIAKARADRDELIEGPTASARDISAQNILTQQELLRNITETENQKVENAYRNLLSSDLTSFSDDSNEDAVPPTISGTYTCDDEGSYQIRTFSSNSESGYSFQVSGLEEGIFNASVDQPTLFGRCGLRIKFDEGSEYRRTEWTIDIPNQKSPQYTINRNNYSLAITQRTGAISAAEQALSLADFDSINQNAPARSEQITRANATIAQAEAQLARIDAIISDRILTAPFGGTVTEIDILPGETVNISPVITLLARNGFEVTARIPEIDIGQLAVGQQVEMFFDAKTDEMITGEIDFISLKSTEIDGVAYYEAVIDLVNVPDWMRSGLNADIDIIINEERNVLRLPKRFITGDESATVLILTGDSKPDFRTTSRTVEVIMEGNDGFVAITGLNEGDTVVSP